LVRLFDPGYQGVLAFRLARRFLQHLDDIARRQQRQARLIIHTWVSNERIANITVTWWCQDRQLRPDSLPVAIALVIFRSALDQ
jgi:hypothetical protein